MGVCSEGTCNCACVFVSYSAVAKENIYRCSHDYYADGGLTFTRAQVTSFDKFCPGVRGECTSCAFHFPVVYTVIASLGLLLVLCLLVCYCKVHKARMRRKVECQRRVRTFLRRQ